MRLLRPPPSFLCLSYLQASAASSSACIHARETKRGPSPFLTRGKRPLRARSPSLYAETAPCARETLPHPRRQPLLCPGAPSLCTETAPCVREPLPYMRQQPLVYGSPFPTRGDNPLCPEAASLYVATAPCVQEPLAYMRRQPLVSRSPSRPSLLFSNVVFQSFSSQCVRMLSALSAYIYFSIMSAYVCFSVFDAFLTSSICFPP